MVVYILYIYNIIDSNEKIYHGIILMKFKTEVYFFLITYL